MSTRRSLCVRGGPRGGGGCGTRNSVLGFSVFLGIDDGDWCPTFSAEQPFVRTASKVWETTTVDLLLRSLVCPANDRHIFVLPLSSSDSGVTRGAGSSSGHCCTGGCGVVVVSCKMVSMLGLSVLIVEGGGGSVFIFIVFVLDQQLLGHYKRLFLLKAN